MNIHRSYRGGRLDSVHIDELRFDALPGREGKVSVRSVTDSVLKYVADGRYHFRVRQQLFEPDTLTVELDCSGRRLSHLDSAFIQQIQFRKQGTDTSSELKVITYDDRGRLSESRSTFSGRSGNQSVSRLTLAYWNDSLIRSETWRFESSWNGRIDSNTNVTTYEYRFNADSSRILSVDVHTMRGRRLSTSVFRYKYLPDGKLVIEHYSDNRSMMHWETGRTPRIRIVPPAFEQYLASWSFTKQGETISSISFDSKRIYGTYMQKTTAGKKFEMIFGCEGGMQRAPRQK